MNESIFSNADAAYIFAYSCMILHTELHNPNLNRERMTLEEFMKNNKGQNKTNDGIEKDFPEDFQS